MSLNGGDPRTYKSKLKSGQKKFNRTTFCWDFAEVFEDNTGAGCETDANKNDGGMNGNSYSYNGDSQQNNSSSTGYSSSNYNHNSDSSDQSSNGHGKTF